MFCESVFVVGSGPVVVVTDSILIDRYRFTRQEVFETFTFLTIPLHLQVALVGAGSPRDRPARLRLRVLARRSPLMGGHMCVHLESVCRECNLRM